MKEEKFSQIIEQANLEKKNCNWEHAAELYEQAAEAALVQNLLTTAAKIYYKLGDICFRAVLASETVEDYVDWNEHSIKAFHRAENLFNQVNNKILSMESKAKALYTGGYVITSIEETRKNLKLSIEIFNELYELHTKENNKEKIIKSSIQTLASIILLMMISSDPSEIHNYCLLGRDILEQVWKLTIEIDNIEFRSDLLFHENILFNFNRWTELIYGDEKQEELRKRFLNRCEDTLKLTENCSDYDILGTIYGTVGNHYCMFGGLFIEEPNERMKFAEIGFDLIEKAILFYRKSRNNYGLVNMLYSIDYLAGLFGRFEYLQKRISNDVREIQKLSKIFDNLYTGIFLFLDFIPISYYNDFSSRGFLKADTRKSYAKIGIKYITKTLKRLAFGPYIIFAYQILTLLYSQLVILANEDEPREEYIQKMLDYAKTTENYAKNYKGGNVRSAGLTSVYRAHKTSADLSKVKVKKIINLEIAIEAAKNNIKYSIESYRIFLASQIRLGLLYEELGILTTNENPLMKARELFLRIIRETSEKGYYYYTAASYEYIARLEDRLGNHIISAEYYEKARSAHEKSLISIKYKLLKVRVKEKIKYASAWSLIEKAKSSHKKENHLKAKKQYIKACNILKELPEFNYEASYFSSWAILEEAEQSSKQEKFEEAIESYQRAEEFFEVAKMQIRFIRKNIKRSKELKKLEKAANVRMKYCLARINLEKGRYLVKEGKHLEAAERFSGAASQFKDICTLFKIEREQKELEAVYYLCKAWENMELAEKYGSSNMFAESANLFKRASELFVQNKFKYLALGNSSFCLALEQGSIFDQFHELDIKTNSYIKAKSILRNAADSYEKGGFKTGADWALATSTYFDATWYLIQADRELEIEKKREFLNIGTSYLKATAKLFGKAGYRDKETEALKRLERVLTEEEILISALNTIKKPSISNSMEAIGAPSCPVEISQSPRIGEIQQFNEEVSQFLETDRIGKKYELVYKDLLEEHPEITQKSEFRIGIAQFGVSTTSDIMSEFFEQTPSKLLRIKKSRIDEIRNRVKEMVEDAQKNGVDLLIFPEMMIDMNDRQMLEDLIKLSKSYEMYIVPGSYHDLNSKKNVCKVISPDGILWEQEKHIPAIIHLSGKRFKEGIVTGSLPRKIAIVNTKFGRIAIAICRDFLDMDLRVELKNFEPPVDIIINPAFTPVTADFKAIHFDARRSIYAYCFFCNVAEFGESLIYTPEKDRTERILPVKKEGLIFKDVNLFKLRSERKKWEIEKKKETQFIQSTR